MFWNRESTISKLQLKGLMLFPFWNNFFFCLRYFRVSSLLNRKALVEDLLTGLFPFIRKRPDKGKSITFHMRVGMHQWQISPHQNNKTRNLMWWWEMRVCSRNKHFDGPAASNQAVWTNRSYTPTLWSSRLIDVVC